MSADLTDSLPFCRYRAAGNWAAWNSICVCGKAHRMNRLHIVCGVLEHEAAVPNVTRKDGGYGHHGVLRCDAWGQLFHAWQYCRHVVLKQILSMYVLTVGLLEVLLCKACCVQTCRTLLAMLCAYSRQSVETKMDVMLQPQKTWIQNHLCLGYLLHEKWDSPAAPSVHADYAWTAILLWGHCSVTINLQPVNFPRSQGTFSSSKAKFDVSGYPDG